MASAYGGVILVGGASDRATEQLTAYRALTEQDAADAVRAYEEAVRDCCSPVPLIDAVSVAHPAGGGFVVAVNVNPVIDQPVGVKVNGDWADGWGDAAFVFHVRLSSHAIRLRPDQLAMFMNPHVRRIAILLAEIPAGAQISLLVRHPRNQFNESPVQQQVRSISVDLLKNVVTAEVAWSERDIAAVRLPLDDVETAWADGAIRFVRLRGFLDGNSKRYISNPTNASFK